MAEVHAAASPIETEDRLRSDFYEFLGALLARPPSSDILARTRDLEVDDTALGRSIAALAAAAASATPADVEREFNRLFIGVGRGELLPFASVYLTGFLNEKPLASLRSDMARHGIARAAHVFEPEDNIGSLCEMMAGLIDGRFGAAASLSVQREFWSRHIGPWATHFFTDLEGAESADFYAPVGAMGRHFMEIEKEAFRLAGDTAA